MSSPSVDVLIVSSLSVDVPVLASPRKDVLILQVLQVTKGG